MHKTTFAILALDSLGSASGANDSPRAAEQEIVRFDFENGDPQGWQVVDGFIDPDAGIKGFVRRRQNPDKELGHSSLATDALQRPYGEWVRPWKRWAGIIESPSTGTPSTIRTEMRTQ